MTEPTHEEVERLFIVSPQFQGYAVREADYQALAAENAALRERLEAAEQQALIEREYSDGLSAQLTEALSARLAEEWNAAMDKAAEIARGNGAHATASAIRAHRRKP